MNSNKNLYAQKGNSLSKYGITEDRLSEEECQKLYNEIKKVVQNSISDERIRTIVYESQGDRDYINDKISKLLDNPNLDDDDEWKTDRKGSSKKNQKFSNRYPQNGKRYDDRRPGFKRPTTNSDKPKEEVPTPSGKPKYQKQRPAAPVIPATEEKKPATISAVLNTPPGVPNAWFANGNMTMAQRLAQKMQTRTPAPQPTPEVPPEQPVEDHPQQTAEVVPEPVEPVEPTEATEPVETAEPTEPEEPTEVLPEVTVEVMTEPVETEQPDEQVPEEIPSEPIEESLPLDNVQDQEEIEQQLFEEQVPVLEEETVIPRPTFSLGNWKFDDSIEVDIIFGAVDYLPESVPTETSDTQPVESEPAVEESKKDAEEQPTDAYTQSNLSSSAPTEFKEPLMTTVPVRTTPEPINVHKEQSAVPSTTPTQGAVPSAVQNIPPYPSGMEPNMNMFNNIYNQMPGPVNNNMRNNMMPANFDYGLVHPMCYTIPVDSNGFYVNNMMPASEQPNTPPPGMNKAPVNESASNTNGEMNAPAGTIPTNNYYGNNMGMGINHYSMYYSYPYMSNITKFGNYHNNMFNNEMPYNEQSYSHESNNANANNNNNHQGFNKENGRYAPMNPQMYNPMMYPQQNMIYPLYGSN